MTSALRALAERHLINYAPYDLITLTPKGKAIAEDVVRRHTTLRDFFIKVLAIEPKEAEELACKMEHAMSENILDRLTQFITFLETCPRGGKDWLKGFASYFVNMGKIALNANNVWQSAWRPSNSNG